MNTLLLAFLVILTVGAAGFALVPSLLGDNRAAKRRKAFQGDIQARRRDNAVARTRDERRKSVQEVLKAQSEEQKRRRRLSLADRIYQAGMNIKPRAFIRNSIIFGVVLFVLLVLVQVPLYFAAVFGIAGGYLLPRLYLARRRRRYQDKFLDELPNAVEAIVRGVKTGLPLNDTIRLVAKEVKEPVRSEFQRILDQQAFGLSTTEAVQVLLERVPLPEVNFFVVVISVQQQAGGNLSEALGNLARVLRNRKKMKLKIKAMSSEAKASAGIIGSLPFVVAGLVTVVSPRYLEPLWSTLIGNVWLGVAGVMLAIGIFVMNRMIQFDF
ncbi:type II secretion system F family protein [Devosia nitrariae]|uniref:Pilus assembly protein n=1 Tax=Devosia nitrariae TaxID=2071872 RepID=A0ABQ5W028_9HYPH|nr:type II secretion system F family protein [Devosia nitrariae]GLQ53256.1 pilus assembly protein [Devosia nitrariae]